jgi:hypothetical protein
MDAQVSAVLVPRCPTRVPRYPKGEINFTVPIHDPPLF